MQDTQLYEQLLGLKSPWYVSEVELNLKRERIDVQVGHQQGVKFACPRCDKLCSVHDHSQVRTWRHLDSCQCLTYIHARPVRVNCSEHGVVSVKLPWSEPRSRFTLLFECLAIEVLKQSSISGACRILKLSWDEAFGVMEHAVARGLARKDAEALPHLGVDEKAIRKGHRYMTLVYNPQKGRVESVSEERTTESLAQFYEGLSPQQREGIQSVTMDMWPAYDRATRQHVPGADEKIIYDPFHIIQHMNKAVDQVRRAEHKKWLSESGPSPLTKKRFWFLKNKEDLPFEQHVAIALMKKADLKTARAWAIKEHLRGLWRCHTKAEAKVYWQRWDSWALHCGMAPVVKVARMVRSHIDNILTFFTHRRTNAFSEGLNSVIQSIKHRAKGFRNFQHFKTAIFFYCGKLNLFPPTH